VIDVLNRIRGPFNLSTTQLDAAEAAVRDQAYVAQCCRPRTARMRSWLANAAGRAGVPSTPRWRTSSWRGFASQEEAEACDTFLKARG
jgi:histidinol-phosphate aminotransferase